MRAKEEIDTSAKKTSQSPTLAQIETFSAIINKGGLKNAAHSLGIDESTARERIATLEVWLGKELFYRRPSLRTTAEGEQFRVFAELIISAFYTFRSYTALDDIARITGAKLELREVFNKVTQRRHFELD